MSCIHGQYYSQTWSHLSAQSKIGGKSDSTVNVTNESGYWISMCMCVCVFVCVLSGFVHVEGCACGVRTFCKRCVMALLSMCEKCTVLSLTCWEKEEKRRQHDGRERMARECDWRIKEKSVYGRWVKWGEPCMSGLTESSCIHPS